MRIPKELLQSTEVCVSAIRPSSTYNNTGITRADKVKTTIICYHLYGKLNVLTAQEHDYSPVGQQ